MSIKSILTLFGGTDRELGALDAALCLTHASRAVTRVLHVSALPSATDAFAVGLYGAAGYSAIDTLRKLDAEADALAGRAGEYVKDYCQRHAIPLRAESDEVILGQAQALFSVMADDPGVVIAKEAATCDLIVTGYDARPDGDMTHILASLLRTQLPVLAIPHDASTRLPASGFSRTAVFAWDGSPASSRALRAAVPHMLHSIDVYVVHVGALKTAEALAARTAMMRYLHSHCIAAMFVEAEKGSNTTGEVLLTQARRLKADLLIMGAYGHGHLVERVMGGVTEHVLRHTDLPLLMVH